MTQQQFIDYLANIYVQQNGKPLAPSTVLHYGKEGMRKINEQLQLIRGEQFSIYEIDDIDELLKLKQELFSLPYFEQLDKVGHNMYSSGMNRYIEYAQGTLFKGKEDLLPLLDRPVPVIDDQPILVKDYHEERTQKIYRRKTIIKTQAEQACNYTCQLDPSHKTFIVERTHHQYMEGHHIIPLNQQDNFKYSLDCHANVIVLCPTCHRFFHYGNHNEKQEELKHIYNQRAERLKHSGIILDEYEFLELANDKPRGTTLYTLY